jgi:hypothetical protein
MQQLSFGSHVNRCQLRLGQGVSRSKTHDALGAWWALKTLPTEKSVMAPLACRYKNPGESRQSALAASLAPPVPTLRPSGGTGARMVRSERRGDSVHAAHSVRREAQQWFMLWYDRPRIRMTWRTLARGPLGAGALAYISLRIRWASSAIGLARIFLKVIAFIIAA